MAVYYALFGKMLKITVDNVKLKFKICMRTEHAFLRKRKKMVHIAKEFLNSFEQEGSVAKLENFS